MFEKDDSLLMPDARSPSTLYRVETTAAALAHALLAERLVGTGAAREAAGSLQRSLLDTFWPELAVLRADPAWSEVVARADQQFNSILRDVDGKGEQQLLSDEFSTTQIQHDERAWDQVFSAAFCGYDRLLRGWVNDLSAEGVPLMTAPVMPQHRLLGLGFSGSGAPSLQRPVSTLDASVPDPDTMEVHNLAHPSIGPGIVHRLSPDGEQAADGTRLFEMARGVEALMAAAPDGTGVYLAWDQAEDGAGAVPGVLVFWGKDVVDVVHDHDDLLSMTRTMLGLRHNAEDPAGATLDAADEAYLEQVRKQLSTFDPDMDDEEEPVFPCVGFRGGRP